MCLASLSTTQPGFATSIYLPTASLFSFLQVSCSKDAFLDNKELKQKFLLLSLLGLVPAEFIGRKIGSPDETFHQTWRIPDSLDIQEPALAHAIKNIQNHCRSIESEGCFTASCLLFLQQDFQHLSASLDENTIAPIPSCIRKAAGISTHSLGQQHTSSQVSPTRVGKAASNMAHSGTFTPFVSISRSFFDKLDTEH
jgi:hypothetical protein